MDTRKLQELRDLNRTTAWLWAWFTLSALGVGVLMGNNFGPKFNGGAFVGGVIGGLIANIPVWVIFDMLRRIVQGQQEIYFANAKNNATP